MPEYLTTSEFQRWAEQFDKKLDEITEIRRDTVQNTIDIALLKEKQTKYQRVNGTLSAVIGGIISALVSYSNK